jgi:hypothetical protein
MTRNAELKSFIWYQIEDGNQMAGQYTANWRQHAARADLNKRPYTHYPLANLPSDCSDSHMVFAPTEEKIVRLNKQSQSAWRSWLGTGTR